MKGISCYITCDNDEVTLWRDVAVLSVSTLIHPPCIHKYFYLCSWWTAVAWYLKNKLKSDQVSKKLVNMDLCSVNNCMTVDKLRVAEVD